MSKIYNVLKALKIANKRIDDLEHMNLRLANESFHKSKQIEELENKTFINPALSKITDLVKRDDFIEITFIGNESVNILFKNKSCSVSSFGRVVWENKND